jgi:hypothetical protein
MTGTFTTDSYGKPMHRNANLKAETLPKESIDVTQTQIDDVPTQKNLSLGS